MLERDSFRAHQISFSIKVTLHQKSIKYLASVRLKGSCEKFVACSFLEDGICSQLGFTSVTLDYNRETHSYCQKKSATTYQNVPRSYSNHSHSTIHLSAVNPFAQSVLNNQCFTEKRLNMSLLAKLQSRTIMPKVCAYAFV